MKKRIMVVFALFMIASLVIGGAFSYFSAAQTKTGRIQSGTLNLFISSSNGDWGTNADVWNVTGMAPGDTVEGALWMLNNGSIAAKQVTFDWSSVLNDPASKLLAENIFLVSAYDSKNPAEAVGSFVSMADGVLGGGTDGKASLAEIAALGPTYGLPFDAVSDVEPFLSPNSAQWLYMKWQFNPAAGNGLQDALATYNLVITARQEHVFP